MIIEIIRDNTAWNTLEGDLQGGVWITVATERAGAIDVPIMTRNDQSNEQYGEIRTWRVRSPRVRQKERENVGSDHIMTNNLERERTEYYYKQYQSKLV